MTPDYVKPCYFKDFSFYFLREAAFAGTGARDWHELAFVGPFQFVLNTVARMGIFPT